MPTGQKRRRSAVFTTLHEDRVPGSWLGHSVSPWGRKREGAQTEERRQQPQQVSDRDRLFGERRKRGRLACLRRGWGWGGPGPSIGVLVGGGGANGSATGDGGVRALSYAPLLSE